MGNKTKETLYDISIENTTITLLPKNNLNKNYSYVLIWLTGLDESNEDYIDMFNHEPSLLPHPDKNKIIILCGEKMKITAFKDDPRGDICHSCFICFIFPILFSSLRISLKQFGVIYYRRYEIIFIHLL